MTKSRDLADIVGDLTNNAGKAVVVNDGGTEFWYSRWRSKQYYRCL